MKKTTFSSEAPSRQEIRYGCVYLAVYLFVLPGVLRWANSLLAKPLSDAWLNLVFYCINFTAVVWIFRHFLGSQLRLALRSVFPTVWYAVLGYLGCQLLEQMLTAAIFRLLPSFVNRNNQSIAVLLEQNARVMILGIVLLVPVAEEALFRGLIFRSLYTRHPAAAYLVSMAAFAMIHLIGYIGTYTPVQLLLCFVQYLPAGFCLAWCYRQTGTILSPMLMHALTNAVSVYKVLR